MYEDWCDEKDEEAIFILKLLMTPLSACLRLLVYGSLVSSRQASLKVKTTAKKFSFPSSYERHGVYF